MRRTPQRIALVLLLVVVGAGLEALRGRWVEELLMAAGQAQERGDLASARRQLQWPARLAPWAVEPVLARFELEVEAENYTIADPWLPTLLEKDLEPTARVRLLIPATRLDMERYRRAAARRHAEQALELARASGQPELEAEAWLGLAELEASENAIPAALEALERCRELALQTGQEDLQAWVEAESGFLRWRYSDGITDPVAEHLEPALEILQRLGDLEGQAFVLGRMANVRLLTDDLSGFFALENQALRLWERQGKRASQAVSHLQLGWAWDRLENPRRAIGHLERALSLAKAAGYLLLVPRLERQLSSVEIRSGRPESAVARLEALVASDRPWELEGRSLYGVLGDGYRDLGDPEKAQAAYERALEFDTIGDDSFRIWIGFGLAQVALAQEQTGRAQDVLEDLEARIGHESSWSDQRRVLLLRAAVLTAREGRAAALAPLLEGTEIETRALSSMGRLTVDYGLGLLGSLLPLLLNPADGDLAITQEVLDEPETLRTVWAAEAFRLLEQSRLRPARQRWLARAGAQTTVTESEERALSLARQAAREVAERPSPQHFARLREAYARYEEEALRSRASTVETSWAQAGTVLEIQQNLAPGTAVLCYVLVRYQPWVLVLRRDRFESIALPGQRSELRPRIKALRHQLALRQGDGWQAPARELWRLLIGPVEAAGLLEDLERLYIVPMGDLHELPFAVLLDAESQPFVERVAVSMLPAASQLLSDDTTASGGGLVMGREAFAGLGLPDLAAAGREVQEVARHTGARPIFGDALSETSFRELAPEAAMIHVVAHARAKPEMPILSSLVLAPAAENADPSADGELTVRELLDLDLRAELVTLSACHTGLALPATRRRSTDLRRTGLIEGFLLAGARNVLGTLFPLEDEATADFMSRFAQELQQQPPIDALATVQRAAAVDGGAKAHPGYWGAFVLTGPGDTRLRPDARSSDHIPERVR